MLSDLYQTHIPGLQFYVLINSEPWTVTKYLVEKKSRRIEEFLREIVSEEAPPNVDDFAANIIFKRFVERDIERWHHEYTATNYYRC